MFLLIHMNYMVCLICLCMWLWRCMRLWLRCHTYARIENIRPLAHIVGQSHRLMKGSEHRIAPDVFANLFHARVIGLSVHLDEDV